MIEIENTDVHGFSAAIRGMRNPLESWDKSDSGFREEFDETGTGAYFYRVGDADRALMMKLIRAGSDHSKFMRMINVTCDITAPMYWWKEMDTYKVGTVRNSCSTMHTIHKKEFDLDDFSHDMLSNYNRGVMNDIVCALNRSRLEFLGLPDSERELKKLMWYQLIQLLPTSYNQRATWQANYAVLRNIYHARKSHKLEEWHGFCTWIKSDLPYSELITEDEING